MQFKPGQKVTYVYFGKPQTGMIKRVQKAKPLTYYYFEGTVKDLSVSELNISHYEEDGVMIPVPGYVEEVNPGLISNYL